MFIASLKSLNQTRWNDVSVTIDKLGQKDSYKHIGYISANALEEIFHVHTIIDSIKYLVLNHKN